QPLPPAGGGVVAPPRQLPPVAGGGVVAPPRQLPAAGAGAGAAVPRQFWCTGCERQTVGAVCGWRRQAAGGAARWPPEPSCRCAVGAVAVRGVAFPALPVAAVVDRPALDVDVAGRDVDEADALGDPVAAAPGPVVARPVPVAVHPRVAVSGRRRPVLRDRLRR